MKPHVEISKLSFVIPIALMWLMLSTSLSARAESLREIRLSLHGGMKTYYWSESGRTLNEGSAIQIHRNEPVRLILQNTTRGDFILTLSKRDIHFLEGGRYNKQGSHQIYLTAGNRTVVELPANHYRAWHLDAEELYTLKHVDRTPDIPDAMVPRVPDTPSLDARLRSARAPHDKAYERNAPSMFPGVNWYKDFLLYSNYFGINSSMWSGRTGLDFMFEHNYDDHYRGQLDFAYNPIYDLDLYVGYEKRDEGRKSKEDSDHWHIGAHYMFPWVETDVLYDKTDHLTVRLRTEIPFGDQTKVFLDYDTNRDWRFKYLYNVTRDLYIVANYHWLYHGGIGLEYAF